MICVASSKVPTTERMLRTVCRICVCDSDLNLADSAADFSSASWISAAVMPEASSRTRSCAPAAPAWIAADATLRAS
jgi:hypothetical protein